MTQNTGRPRARKTLLKLFVSIFTRNALTVGGGAVIIPLMKKRFVEELGWFSEADMLDAIALAQLSPGAVAVNVAFVTGCRLFGLKGGLTALFAAFLPPFLIFLPISYFYAYFSQNARAALFSGLTAAVCAVMFCASYDFLKAALVSRGACACFAACFAATFFLETPVGLIIVFAALIGLIINR